MNPTSLALGRSTCARLVGALPPHPRLPPLRRRLTPVRDRRDKGNAHERITMVNKRSTESQRRLDNTFKDGILHNQVASFSMHFWLILWWAFPSLTGVRLALAENLLVDVSLNYVKDHHACSK